MSRNILCDPGNPADFSGAGRAITGNDTRARWRFRQVLKCPGIERVDAHGRLATIHGLRHSFCPMLARAGVGLVQAQQMMGHSDHARRWRCTRTWVSTICGEGR